MWIYRTRSTTLFRTKSRFGLGQLRLAALGGVLFAFVVAFGLIAIPEIRHAARASDLFQNTVKPLYSIFTREGQLERVVRAQFSRPPRIFLDLSHENYTKLEHQRSLAMEVGKLYLVHPLNTGYVNAKIGDGEETFQAKVRLKGGSTDHFGDSKKWSLKVRIKGDHAIMGMKHFAIQPPSTRNYLNEWVLQSFGKYIGLIGLRYDYVHLFLNGEDYGIFAIEENMGKELLAENRRREGPIVGWNTDIVWGNKLLNGAAPHFFSSNIRAYNEAKILESPDLTDQFHNAKSLLEQFRNDKLSASNVFDVTQLARFFAMIDLFGHAHATALYNIKFYFNPVTTFLEPIIYDNQVIKRQDRTFRSDDALVGGQKKIGNFIEKSRYTFWSNTPWYETLFKDPKFYAEYIRQLEFISEPSLLDDFFKKYESELTRKIISINKSYPGYFFEHEKILRQNQGWIRDQLTPFRAIQAYFDGWADDNNAVGLSVTNIHQLPIQIKGLQLEEGVIAPVINTTVLQPNSPLEPAKHTRVFFQLPQTYDRDTIFPKNSILIYTLLGGSQELTDEVYPWRHESPQYRMRDIVRSTSNIDQFDLFEIDDLSRTINIRVGDWTLKESVHIPSGYTVTGSSKTRVNLVDGAGIYSQSAFQIIGSDDHPFIFHSTDRSGQGLTVINADQLSMLKNVTFSELQPPVSPGWKPTGAITFYKSPVAFIKCSFLNNSGGDDHVNIIDSDFSVDRSFFAGSHADALDVDFAEGSITNSDFLQCGNDCIDLSGSVVTINSVGVKSAGDKGVSVGEHSHVRGIDLEVRETNIGIASKDLSDTHFDRVYLRNNTISLAAYQKKPEFGPGTLTLNTVFPADLVPQYFLQRDSTIKLNGVLLPELSDHRLTSIVINPL